MTANQKLLVSPNLHINSYISSFFPIKSLVCDTDKTAGRVHSLFFVKNLAGMMMITCHLQPPCSVPPPPPSTGISFKTKTPLHKKKRIYPPDKALQNWFDCWQGSHHPVVAMEGRWRWAFLLASLVSYIGSDAAADEGGGSEGDGRKGLCSTDLTTFLPFPYSNLPNMVCQPLWNSYLLRYSKSKDNEITMVLSTIYTSGWVGIGFSRDGKMLNSSCMVGWVNQEGQGRIKQYHIKGFTPSEIKPERGELPLTNVPPYVAVQGATIYLSFQLKFNTTLKTQPLLLAFSTKPPHHHRLTVHEDKTTIYLDFSAGKTDDSSGGVKSYLKDRRTHGTLAVMGWGFFLPTGAIMARYLSRKDKVWYYFHVPIQFIGFLLGVAAVIVGVSLYSKMHVFFPAHRGIGIFLLVITILQVLAFFTRPSSDSKYRRYWNWYHNWVGRICLFFGAVNILVGIHIADAGQGWKIGYGFLLGFLLVTVIVLEALLWLRRSADADKQHPPFSINSIDREISL